MPVSPPLKIGTGVGDSEKSDLQARQAEHNEYHRLNSASDNWRIEPNWWQAGIAVFALIVAGFQAWLFVSQLRKMDESIADAKDTSKAELRAYVSAEVKNVFHFNSKKPLIFEFEAINHGRTPAKDVEFGATVDIAPNDTKSLRGIDSGWNPGRMNLFPNANGTTADRGVIPCNCERIFNAEEIAQFRAGTHFIYIGLEIQYWDFIGNKDHITRNYYKIGGSQTALQLLTAEEGEGVVVTWDPNKEGPPRPTLSLIPRLGLIT